MNETPKIRSAFGWGFRVPKNEKNQDSFRWASEERKPKDKDSFGWASEERKPKDKDSFGWASEERKPKDKDSFGWASDERKPKDKDSFGFGVSEFPKNESPKDSFVNRKPRFVSFGKSGTKIRLVSQAAEKTKDSVFPKNQDS
ncbi:unnamed protein product [Rhizophagus irregularis]|nr:unnamed protein product [Rhizophagus irregularis]